ncbi:MAG: hypothetical protein FWC89_13145 [Defluviitaleaceae bacterium]|nr:hypothetical protein [Defluviitaleaceae bacterium]
MSDFFEFKYITCKAFYENYYGLKLGCNGAGSKCLVDFELIIDEFYKDEYEEFTGEKRDAKALAVYSELLKLIAKFKGDLTYFRSYYEDFIKLHNNIEIDEILTEKEKRYFHDDMAYIKRAFNTNDTRACCH